MTFFLVNSLQVEVLWGRAQLSRRLQTEVVLVYELALAAELGIPWDARKLPWGFSVDCWNQNGETTNEM